LVDLIVADSVDRLSYISPLVTGVLWFAPIIVITKFVNLFWFQVSLDSRSVDTMELLLFI